MRSLLLLALLCYAIFTKIFSNVTGFLFISRDNPMGLSKKPIQDPSNGFRRNVFVTTDEQPVPVSTDTCKVFEYPSGMFMDSGDSGFWMCVKMKKKASRPRMYTLPQGTTGIALMLACNAKIFAFEQFQMEIEILYIVFEFLQPNGSIVTISCSSPFTEYDEVDTSRTWTATIYFTGDGIASKVSILGKGQSPFPITDKESLVILPYFPPCVLDKATG